MLKLLMGYEDQEIKETAPTSSPKSSGALTLQKAIDLGEYNPEFLSTFAEWHTLSRHVQFQFIKKAIDNRNQQLLVQWAEINNMLDFRLKPHLTEALKNIEVQLKKLNHDREKLYTEYSK